MKKFFILCCVMNIGAVFSQQVPYEARQFWQGNSQLASNEKPAVNEQLRQAYYQAVADGRVTNVFEFTSQVPYEARQFWQGNTPLANNEKPAVNEQLRQAYYQAVADGSVADYPDFLAKRTESQNSKQ